MSKKRLGILLVVMLLAASVSLGGAEGARNIKVNPNNLFTETVVDLEGRTIKWATGWIGTYDYWENKAETPTDVLKNIQILKDIEADYNCKIELVDLDGINYWSQELSEQFAMAKTSGDTFADILDWQTNMNPGTVIYKDYLVGIQDIPYLMATVDAGAWSVASMNTEYDGKIYGLNNEAPLGYIRSLLLYNKDYAAEYGIEDMYALVNNDGWNFDKFMEICEKAYDQSGGKVSGIVTRYGMPGALLEQFMTSNNAVPFAQKDGDLITSIGTEKGIRAAQFVVDMINKKLIDLEVTGDPFDYFVAGKCMFYIAQGWEVGSVAEELNADIGVLPMPKGPDATEYASYFDQIRITSIVNNGSDNADAAARVLVAFKARQADTYLDYEDEGTPYDWLDDLSYDVGDAESLAMAEIINKGVQMNYITMLANVPGWGDAKDQICKGMATPAEAMGAIVDQIQAVIDEANK